MAKARKSKSHSLVSGAKRLPEPAGAGPLLDDVRRLIDETRQQVAQTVNSAMVALYWQIGKRVREDILPKCARWSGGVSGRSGRRSTGCCSNGRHCRRNPTN